MIYYSPIGSKIAFLCPEKELLILICGIFHCCARYREVHCNCRIVEILPIAGGDAYIHGGSRNALFIEYLQPLVFAARHAFSDKSYDVFEKLPVRWITKSSRTFSYYRIASNAWYNSNGMKLCMNPLRYCHKKSLNDIKRCAKFHYCYHIS